MASRDEINQAAEMTSTRASNRGVERLAKCGTQAGAATGRVFIHGGVSCASSAISKTSPAFSVTRKRRKSFPSETHVKRGRRFVHGDVELTEKLGRNDLCPCSSGRRFQILLHEIRHL
jgi:hypothetical protein